MAKFYAIAEADIVGSDEHLPLPEADPLNGSDDAFFVAFPPFPSSSYAIFNSDPDFGPNATVTSFANFASADPFVFGAGAINNVWKADPGDDYLLGDDSVASDDTLFGLIFAPDAGDPTKTHGTEQQINQFFFKFEDRIHGSEEDDKLCGWAEDDVLWGDEGDDEFFYGEGMGKDQIKDLTKSDDELILDEDLVDNFKDLKGDVKLKSDKIVMNFGGGDKLVVFGIDTLKDLKSVVAFDDFTDFA